MLCWSLPVCYNINYNSNYNINILMSVFQLQLKSRGTQGHHGKSVYFMCTNKYKSDKYLKFVLIWYSWLFHRRFNLSWFILTLIFLIYPEGRCWLECKCNKWKKRQLVQCRTLIALTCTYFVKKKKIKKGMDGKSKLRKKVFHIIQNYSECKNNFPL